MQLTDTHKTNFETLGKAFMANHVALAACIDAKTGELVPTICAVNLAEDGQVELVPFGRLFDGDPYEQVLPPTEEDEPCAN